MDLTLLNSTLSMLESYLNTKDLLELCINQPGEIFLETRKGWIKKQDKHIDNEYLWNLGHLLATASHQRFDENSPMLSTTIPGYGYRIQMISNAIAGKGISVSIRVGTALKFPMSNYFDKEGEEKIIAAALSKKTILVAGGTSTGKTTFLNSLLEYIPKDERIVTIEDAQELVVPHQNWLSLMKAKSGTDIAGISYKDLFNASMRSRPERLIMGEMDVDNAFPFLRIINSGHGGTLATIHANSPQEAIDALVLNVQLSGTTTAPPEQLEKLARKGIDIIVHLHRENRNKIIAKMEDIN